MSFDAVIAELKEVYGYVGGPDDGGHTFPIRMTREDVERWAKLLDEPHIIVCERIAAYIVRGFHSRDLSYEFCDAIANYLWSYMIDQSMQDQMEWSPFVEEVYDAFDQGEWPHGERLDEDPAEVHTRPLVAAIIARLDSLTSR